MPPEGGSGRITVTTSRECAWTASAESPWLSINGTSNGQGDGAIEFRAAANPDPVSRRGTVAFNDSRAEVMQAAAECVITLGESSASFPQAGGSGTVDVVASSPLCTWTATAIASWVSITSGANGKGSAPVAFAVAPTSGPPRTSVVMIGGQRFNVIQSEGCTYAIAPGAQTFNSSGGMATVALTTGPGCPWMAGSNVPWVSVAQSSGSGSASITLSVSPTEGPERVGTVIIAGQPFTVTQGPGCSYQVNPTSHDIAAGGGSASVTVTSVAGCAWTASSDAPWLTITGGSSGTGTGTVAFSAAASSGPSRTGTLTVAGQRVTVTQTQGCAFSIDPSSASVASGGGTGSVAVTAGGGCAWTASANVDWITISEGRNGSGNGTVRYSVAATTGPGRSGTMTIAGRTFTINQGQGCTFSISPSSQNVPSAGGNGTVNVTGGSGCAWTATSNAPWLSITEGASGSGNGSVRFSAAGTSGPARAGTLTIAGHTFTVNQGQGCSFTLAPDNATVPAAGATRTFDVQTAGGCAWTATSNAPWLSIPQGGSGTGNGTVTVSAAANTGAARTGTVTAGGHTFTINQEGGCSYSLSSSSTNVGAPGGAGSVNVMAAPGCAWTATSQAGFLSVTSGASGSGDGRVEFSIAANAGAARSGTLSIAGATFTVNQDGGCTFGITPQQQNVDPPGGPVSVSVSGSGGCAWTAASNVPWITITSGASGNGGGNVQMNVAANNEAARVGTVTIAGQTFTVNQSSGCSYTVSPDPLTVPAGAGPAQLTVTTTASCAWTAASGVPWAAVTAGASGTGSGPVQLAIEANNGPARSGSLAVAGRMIPIAQDSGCTFTLSAPGQSTPAAGGTGSVTVTTTAGCTWTAASQVPWIVITAGAGGTNPVEFTIQPNGTGAARAGTILIAGQTYTVNQGM